MTSAEGVPGQIAHMKTMPSQFKDVMIVSLALNFGLAATIVFLLHLDFVLASSRTSPRPAGVSPGWVIGHGPGLKGEPGLHLHHHRL